MTTASAKGEVKRPAPGCLLAGLAEPRLGGVVPGLVLRDGMVEVANEAFRCCPGDGFRFDRATNVTTSCALTARLHQTRVLAWQFTRTYNGEDGSPSRSLPAELAPKAFGPLLTRLSAISRGLEPRGVALLTPEGGTRAVSAWAIAIAAAWRFGLATHVVTLGKKGPGTLLPKAGAPTPKLVVVENVTRLWDAATAEQLEAVVGYCYGAMLPLFLDVTLGQGPAKAPRAGAGRSTKESFGAVIAGVKARNADSWLAPDCVSKLRKTTDGLDLWLGAPKRREPPRPGPPPLVPWK